MHTPYMRIFEQDDWRDDYQKDYHRRSASPVSP